MERALKVLDLFGRHPGRHRTVRFVADFLATCGWWQGPFGILLSCLLDGRRVVASLGSTETVGVPDPRMYLCHLLVLCPLVYIVLRYCTTYSVHCKYVPDGPFQCFR